jgi:hypothetical protein
MLWILIALSVVYGGLAETEPKVERLAAEPAVLPALEMWTVPGEHLVVRNYGG